MALDISIQTKFWNKVSKSSPDECWLWTGATTQYGYGMLGKMLAHRLSYVIANNLDLKDIADWHVLHSCDNPPCVNPSHLRTGTHDDNMNDAKTRKRFAYYDSPTATRRTKLSIRDIKEIQEASKIRFQWGTGYTQSIADKYGVSGSVIRNIWTKYRRPS